MNYLFLKNLSTVPTKLPNISAESVLAGVLNTFYFVTGSVAVIVIIIAGFYFVTSAGNANNITRAKNAILYAVIGLIIVTVAFAITQFVIGAF